MDQSEQVIIDISENENSYCIFNEMRQNTDRHKRPVLKYELENPLNRF